MAVTAISALVKAVTTDPARPPGHAGWNNPYGDPSPWIEDIDWYRRVQLVCTGSAGEVSTTVNWEVADPTLQMQTTTTLTTGSSYTGTNPTLYGALVNNSTTWTIWATNGSVTANTIKYTDTGQRIVCLLRANGPRVQVLLGPARPVGAASVTYTIGAWVPSLGPSKTPHAQTTQTVNPRATYDQPTSISVSGTATITSPATTTTLTATVSPGTAVQAVTWTSSDVTKATVASATALTGTVTATGGATGNGTTVIKALAVGNSGITSSGTTVTTSGFTLREADADREPTPEEEARDAIHAEEEPEPEEAKDNGRRGRKARK